MRVYLPATVPMLRDWLGEGVARPAGSAYAVTPALREWYREGDAEELEHAAATLAAIAALDLLVADPRAPARRVVLAVDVNDGDCSPDPDERGALRLRGSVSSAQWASALVDGPDAESAVSAAIGVLRDPGAGADDVEFARGEAEAVELGWYAVQELDFL